MVSARGGAEQPPALLVPSNPAERLSSGSRFDTPAAQPKAQAAEVSAPSLGDILQYTFFNKPPTANPQQTPGQSPLGVVAGNFNAGGPTGAVLTYTLANRPAKGDVEVSLDGTYTYTPGTEFANTGGSDGFTVTIDNGTAFRLTGVAGVIQGALHSLAQAIGLSGPDTITVAVPVNVTAIGYATGITAAFSGFASSVSEGDRRDRNDAVDGEAVCSVGWDGHRHLHGRVYFLVTVSHCRCRFRR